MRSMPSYSINVCCFIFCMLALTGSVAAAPLSPVIPRTEKKFLLHLEPLSAGLEEAGEAPTLVSLTETTTLHLPHGARQDRDEHLSFNEDLDPFWVHLLRRRRLNTVEWSGCGGLWRPAWTGILENSSIHNNNDNDNDNKVFAHSNISSMSDSTRELIYDLSHHTVCYFSSLSACGWNYEADLIREEIEFNSTIKSDEDARKHHQWLSQFVSSLLSSPLSWSHETPRHIRPVGALRSVPSISFENNINSEKGIILNKKIRSWCSYHLAQHDTLCTQHVSALLNGGRSGKGVEENIPKGIFRAGLVSMQDFFSSGFHHFHFSVSQSPISDEEKKENNTEETKVKLLIRMAYVAREKDFKILANHWKNSLPPYANKLHLFIGNDVNKELKNALQSVMSKTEKVKSSLINDKNTINKNFKFESKSIPTANYYISTEGHDRGFYRLVVFPSSNIQKENYEEYNKSWNGLKVGDTLDSLIIFPLHVLRPSLHEMRSEFEGLTLLENVFFDDSANVLLVYLKTVLTEENIRKLNENNKGIKNNNNNGILICEFPFHFGWAALRDMPHDANSNRILPQPVVRLGVNFVEEELKEENKKKNVINFKNNKECSKNLKCHSINALRIDHQEALERLLESMIKTKPNNNNNNSSSCACYFWLRCSNVAGTTIPVPDPAMVFNVVSLGLVSSAMMSGAVTRITRRLFDGPKIEKH